MSTAVNKITENKLVYPKLQNREQLLYVPKESIPDDPQSFYKDFGYLRHAKTGREVLTLADYQIKVWSDKSKYRLVVKSQKVGLSTSCLLEDFQISLKRARGKDILLIAQTQDQANEHLLTLKLLIANSRKYKKYLITGNELTFKEQKTKLNTIFIKNPDNPTGQTRIIGKGPSEAALWSWKNVAHIHMSDIAANGLKDDSPIFAAAFSRLASTDGTMLIETPPRGPRKKVFEIYQESLIQQDNPELQESRFSIHHVSAQEGVEAGVISQAFLDAERHRLGPTMYAQNYECVFTAATGNLFNQNSIDAAIYRPYNRKLLIENRAKYMAIDPGFAQSKFAIIIGQWNPSAKRMEILEAEEMEAPKVPIMINRILAYRFHYKNVVRIAVDATSKMEFVDQLKDAIGESSGIPYIKERMEYAKKHRVDLSDMMIVIPIIFTTESKAFMASRARRVLDDPRGAIAIDPSFITLITGLRSAVFDDKGQLDKDLSPHDDLIDAFQMLTSFVKYRPK